MATPNYSYEKRQRELAKKRKAEEKRQKKGVPGSEPGPADANPASGHSDPAAPPVATPPAD